MGGVEKINSSMADVAPLQLVEIPSLEGKVSAEE